MSKSFVNIFFMALFLLQISSCGGSGSTNEPKVAEQNTIEKSIIPANLNSFYFLHTVNPHLSSDIYVAIENHSLTAVVDFDTPIDNLIATFDYDGINVSIDGVKQISGKTINDHSTTLIYTIEAEDGTTQRYSVAFVKQDDTRIPPPILPPLPEPSPSPEPPEEPLPETLPVLSIVTENNAPIDSKEDYVEGIVSVESQSTTFTMQDTIMKIRGRGNSTWFTHPKKPYQMKLADDGEMLGMPKDRKWLFLAEYSDKTLLRNTIAFEMGHISNLDWTPASTFAEVKINGEYNGVYNITQKVEVSNNRVALGDTGYLLEIDQFDRIDADDVYFYSNNFLLNVKAPKIDFGSSEHLFIEDLIKDFEQALHGSQFKDPTIGYAKYIDIDSFIDWYLISEITKNVDSKFFSSIYLNVIPGEKIKMGPLWDFDLAFGNTDYADSQYSHGYWVKDHTWYTRLFQDPAFVSKIKTRFAFFKANQQYILDKIDQQAKYLDDAQQKNDEKWQTIGIYIWPNPVIFDTYEGEVLHLKTWYIERMNWLDIAFNNL